MRQMSFVSLSFMNLEQFQHFRYTDLPFLANAVGATKPDAIDTRHKATNATNALKAMVMVVEKEI